MVWRLVVALLLVAGVARDASANGRPPGTSSITFRQDNPNEIVVGLTFGLLFSHDGGQTWAWMCEDAIGYTGVYDPRYSYSNSGALFATTFDGLKVVRDRCTFSAMPSGLSFTSTSAIGPDQAFYYAAAQTADPGKALPADFKIYKSTDDGVSFTSSVAAGADDVNDWWQTLVVAPSRAQRVYATGYSYQPAAPGMEAKRTHLLFRSDNGGVNWTPMAIAGLTLAANSVVEIVGVHKTQPDHIYARVKLDDNTISDSLYRSLDAGVSWTQIKHVNGSITSFVARANGDLVYGTQTLGAAVSHDDGASWIPLVDPPHLSCLVENAAGEVWACTQNYSYQNVMSDNAGVMKSTDLVTWTKVLRYQDLTEAVTCAAGTRQHDTCAAMWCAVCEQLGCKPAAAYNCPIVEPTEAPVTGGGKSGGCCDTGAGAGGAGALALALAVGTVMLRPRRRRATP